jgi:hypothetical protein
MLVYAEKVRVKAGAGVEQAGFVLFGQNKLNFFRMSESRWLRKRFKKIFGRQNVQAIRCALISCLL